MPLIGRTDVVGHLGTRFSYARIASEVALALHRIGMLGRVINMDEGLVEDAFEDEVRRACRGGTEAGRSALLVIPPREQIDAFLAPYPGRVSLFVCPNTDAMDPRHIERIARFDHLIVPSLACHDAVCRSLVRDGHGEHHEPVVAPLGIGETFIERGFDGTFFSRGPAYGYFRRRAHEHGSPIEMLHLSTDWFLPGRKGTEELVDAWLALPKDVRALARLTMLVPPSIAETVYYRAGDKGLTEPELFVRTTPKTGMTDAELCELMGRHDLLVQPARAEGYAMMIKSAVAMKMPVITTDTGEPCYEEEGGGVTLVDYVDDGKKKAALYGEYGLAPLVDVEDLGNQLAGAIIELAELGVSVRERPAWLDTGELSAYRWPLVADRWARMLSTDDGAEPWSLRRTVAERCIERTAEFEETTR